MRVTGTDQHEAWQARVLPPVEQVRPGIWSVPVPIPQSPLRYTLCYLLVGAETGLLVVDPGWDTDEGWAALTGGLAAAGAAPADVSGIVVTHIHPDHHGMSPRLREASGAWIGMHPAERDSLPARHWVEDSPQTDRSWLRRCGLPDDAVDELGWTTRGIAHALALVEPDRLIEDGDLLPAPADGIRAVWTPGHTPGHLCLHAPEQRLLLTGDHVLPRITPNVGLNMQHADPPLADFLASLDRLAALDDDRTPRLEAAPAHEYRFTGVAARVRQLQRHHAHRCDEIADLVARLGKPTLWELTEQLTWSRDWSAVQGFMRRAALGETTAHVKHLVAQGRLAWQEPATEGDPVRVHLAG